MYNLLAIHIIYILAKKRAVGQGAKASEIADTLGISRTTSWRYLKSMIDDGIVMQRGEYYFMYIASPLVRAFVDASNRFDEEMAERYG